MAVQEANLVSFSKILSASDAKKGGQLLLPKECGDLLFPTPGKQKAFHDMNGVRWIFKHGFNGDPLRHRLSAGWSRFVRKYGLQAGDTVILSINSDGLYFIDVRRRELHGDAQAPPVADRGLPLQADVMAEKMREKIPPQVGGDQSDGSSNDSREVRIFGCFFGEASDALPVVTLPAADRGLPVQEELAAENIPRQVGDDERDGSSNGTWGILPKAVRLFGQFIGEASDSLPVAKRLKTEGGDGVRSLCLFESTILPGRYGADAAEEHPDRTSV